MNRLVVVAMGALIAAVLLGLALSADTALGAQDERQRLWRDYGISLIDGPGDDRWTLGEISAIATRLAQLPAVLSHVGKHSPFGAIRVFKNSVQQPDAAQTPLSWLYWQMIVALGEGDDVRGLPPEVKLERRFVQALLYVYDAQTGLSSDAAWLVTSGWHQHRYFGLPLPLIPDSADNQDERDYASTVGRSSPRNDFADYGAAFFVPDPEPAHRQALACRTPEKSAFFRRSFVDQGEDQCPSRGPGDDFLSDLEFLDPLTRAPLPMGPVNDATVTGFELLYATPGVADAAEVAGHLLLRLRLKNERDIVVSFLADTDGKEEAPAKAAAPPPPLPTECAKPWSTKLPLLGAPEAQQSGDLLDPVYASLQAIKGLSGGFLSVLDRQTLAQTVRTYTVEQDRNLLRYRLNLTPAQSHALLQRLYGALKNYRTKYYFFDRNCASILVRLIGEALRDDELINFDPLVAPPNTLVSLLIRKGLATPVAPAFYSYRKRGYLAQEAELRLLKELATQHPERPWPAARDVIAPDDSVRRAAFVQLALAVPSSAKVRAAVYRLASYGQEAELAFADHSQRCEDVTSATTEALRSLQQQLAAADPDLPLQNGLDLTAAIAQDGVPGETERNATGSAHTGLAPLGVAAGPEVMRSAGTGASSATNVLVLDAALHRQQFGDFAAQSMQRASAVTLGAVQAVVTNDDGTGELRDFQVTGLSLRKLRERLDSVPATYDEQGSFGLGLTLLDGSYHAADQTVRMTMIGGELIANLAASPLYDRYLSLSLRAGLAEQWRRPLKPGQPGAPALTGFQGFSGFDSPQIGLILPVRLSGLWTWDDRRQWQLRGEAEMRPEILAGRVTTGLLAEVDLVYRCARGPWGELLPKLSVTSERLPPANGDTGAVVSRLALGLDWNRW